MANVHFWVGEVRCTSVYCLLCLLPQDFEYLLEYVNRTTGDLAVLAHTGIFFWVRNLLKVGGSGRSVGWGGDRFWGGQFQNDDDDDNDDEDDHDHDDDHDGDNDVDDEAGKAFSRATARPDPRGGGRGSETHPRGPPPLWALTKTLCPQSSGTLDKTRAIASQVTLPGGTL